MPAGCLAEALLDWRGACPPLSTGVPFAWEEVTAGSSSTMTAASSRSHLASFSDALRPASSEIASESTPRRHRSVALTTSVAESDQSREGCLRPTEALACMKMKMEGQ